MNTRNTFALGFMVCVAFALISAQKADGQMVFFFEQDGTDMTVTASGSVDLTGLTFDGVFAIPQTQIRNIDEVGYIWSNIQEDDLVYAVPNPYFLFSANIPPTNGIATGDAFGLFTYNQNDGQNLAGDAFVYFSDGFTGGPVDGKFTAPNTSLASLGLNEGVLTWGPNPNQSLIITTVPEPTSLALLGLGGLMVQRHRRRM